MLVAIVAVGMAGHEFYETDRRLQEVRHALKRAEPGTALLVAGQYDPACVGCFPKQIDALHAGALAVIERQMFVPTLFTATSLVAASPKRHDLDVPGGLPRRRDDLIVGRTLALPERGPEHDAAHPYWYSWDANYDYLLWLRGNGESLDDIAGLERLASGEIFVLYRIHGPLQGVALQSMPPVGVE